MGTEKLKFTQGHRHIKKNIKQRLNFAAFTHEVNTTQDTNRLTEVFGTTHISMINFWRLLV